MNILEKILEEIEERIKRLKEADNMCRANAERNRNFESMKYFQSLMFATERAESIIGDIIRSHMDDIPNTSNKRLIDANVLDEEVRKFFLAITGNPKQATVVRECKESFRRMIDEQKTVYANDDWILVKERLPKESGYYLVQLSKRLESEDWADRVVVLYDGESKEFMCYEKYIIAWKPLPEPYRAADKPDWEENMLNTFLAGH